MFYLGNYSCDKMIKKKLLTISIMVLFVIISSYSTLGTIITYDNMSLSFGKILYVGGSGPGNYTRIQDAIDDSNDGDTVFVYNGTYYENIVIYKSISIFGEAKITTIIDGGGSLDVVVIAADWVNISGFTIQNSGDQWEAGIYICSNFNIVTDNTISNNDFGIRLHSSKNNTIWENTFGSKNIIGIHLGNSSNNNIIFHNNFINNTQHANDECNNSWDNGYPSCGNYWDDYVGRDNLWGINQSIPGMDGVGDTPYDLPCEYASDRYPLIESYGKTELSFQIRGGLFKYSGVIQNGGNKTAFNVHWKITIEGGFILIGRNFIGKLKPLLPFEKATVTSVFIFGIGRVLVTIAVWADNAPYIYRTTPGILLLFIFQITPGGFR
jgi:parallel beta-helix repeat protein